MNVASSLEFQEPSESCRMLKYYTLQGLADKVINHHVWISKTTNEYLVLRMFNFSSLAIEADSLQQFPEFLPGGSNGFRNIHARQIDP